MLSNEQLFRELKNYRGEGPQGLRRGDLTHISVKPDLLSTAALVRGPEGSHVTGLSGAAPVGFTFPTGGHAFSTPTVANL